MPSGVVDDDSSSDDDAENKPAGRVQRKALENQLPWLCIYDTQEIDEFDDAAKS